MSKEYLLKKHMYILQITFKVSQSSTQISGNLARFVVA